MTNDITQVCVLTGRGMSAIGSVALCGAGARGILDSIFQKQNNPLPPSEDSPLAGGEFNRVTSVSRFCRGDISYGMIVDGTRIVDEVLVGCEEDDLFVIHCHGNPLLIEQVVKLCRGKGAELVDAEAFAFARHLGKSGNTIEAEAKLAMQNSATLLGAKILNAQIGGGLSKWARDALANMDASEVQQQAAAILEKSLIAKRIVDGVRIVIAGPPNSGKSTLLNCLSGRQEVIVSDMAGTTRDWVSIHCKLGPLAAEFVDTAGLDEVLAGTDDIEQTAQTITRDLIDTSDLIVYVTDVTVSGSRQQAVGSINKPVVWVENKGDLVQEYMDSGTQELKNSGIQECRNIGMDERKSQASRLKSVRISAKENAGIDALVEAILAVLRVDEVSVGDAVAFTPRQYAILQQCHRTTERADCKLLFEKLLSNAL